MPEHDAERTSLDAARAMYARPKADPNKIREIETETRKEMQAKGATDEEIAKAIRERTADYRLSLLPEAAKKLVDSLRLARGHSFRDVIRNLDKFGKAGKEARQLLYETIERPFNETTDRYTRSLNATVEEIKRVFKENGIDVTAKDRKTKALAEKKSAAVQKFGEGFYYDEFGDRQTYTLDDLKKEFPDDWEGIANTAQYCREVYDEYIDDLNAMLEQIYPNVIEHAETKLSKFKEYEDAARTRANEQDAYVEELKDELGTLERELAGVQSGTRTEEPGTDMSTKNSSGRFLAQNARKYDILF